jgi:hypothetical protein
LFEAVVIKDFGSDPNTYGKSLAPERLLTVLLETASYGLAGMKAIRRRIRSRP